MNHGTPLLSLQGRSNSFVRFMIIKQVDWNTDPELQISSSIITPLLSLISTVEYCNTSFLSQFFNACLPTTV